jgi:hypothetical protein
MLADGGNLMHADRNNTSGGGKMAEALDEAAVSITAAQWRLPTAPLVLPTHRCRGKMSGTLALGGDNNADIFGNRLKSVGEGQATVSGAFDSYHRNGNGPIIG